MSGNFPWVRFTGAAIGCMLPFLPSLTRVRIILPPLLSVHYTHSRPVSPTLFLILLRAREPSSPSAIATFCYLTHAPACLHASDTYVNMVLTTLSLFGTSNGNGICHYERFVMKETSLEHISCHLLQTHSFPSGICDQRPCQRMRNYTM